MNEEIILEKFAERFSKLVKNSSIEVAILAQMLGIKSKSTIYRYMNAEMTPKLTTVKYASEIFNVNPLWLMGYDVDKYVTKKEVLGNSISPVPLLASVKDGYNYLAQENWIGTVYVEKSLVGNGKNYFALKVKDNTMAPVFTENDIVIIKKQNDCDNNEFAIVIINEGEGTLKKIKKIDNGIILQPLNPAYRSCNVH